MAQPGCIKLHDRDNVAIVVNDGGLPAGTRMPNGVTLAEDIPQAHKFTLVPIRKGEPVVRYGVTVGLANTDLPVGAWVNEQRVQLPTPPGLDQLRAGLAHFAPRPVPPLEPLEGYTFQGYRNPDGSVGTRNILAISTTVQCAAPVARAAVERIRARLLPLYPNVDNVVAIEHIYGCGVAINAPDAYIPIRTLQNIAKNPNFGCLPLLVSLGCEKLSPDRFFPEGAIPCSPLTAAGEEHVISLQDERIVGFGGMLNAILEAAEKRLKLLDARRRQTCPASDLVLGMECGGSDAFSGAAANPAVGVAADMLVRAGGTAFFSENTEVRDGIDQLVARAANADVARDLIDQMAWYDAYLARGGADRSANTTPGNKKGGLNNITEKAMGSIAKSGSMPISAVVDIGDKIRPDQKGLLYVAAPASDLACTPELVAAGMNLLIFITGRGTPYSLAEVPVMKVVTRTALANRWHDLVDVNAGRIVDGQISVQGLGKEIFEQMLEVASGKKTAGEKLGLSNYMAIFNPAPIT